MAAQSEVSHRSCTICEGNSHDIVKEVRLFAIGDIEFTCISLVIFAYFNPITVEHRRGTRATEIR